MISQDFAVSLHDVEVTIQGAPAPSKLVLSSAPAASAAAAPRAAGGPAGGEQHGEDHAPVGTAAAYGSAAVMYPRSRRDYHHIIVEAPFSQTGSWSGKAARLGFEASITELAEEVLQITVLDESNDEQGRAEVRYADVLIPAIGADPKPLFKLQKKFALQAAVCYQVGDHVDQVGELTGTVELEHAPFYAQLVGGVGGSGGDVVCRVWLVLMAPRFAGRGLSGRVGTTVQE